MKLLVCVAYMLYVVKCPDCRVLIFSISSLLEVPKLHLKTICGVQEDGIHNKNQLVRGVAPSAHTLIQLYKGSGFKNFSTVLKICSCVECPSGNM